jgi:hypothetical protein
VPEGLQNLTTVDQECSRHSKSIPNQLPKPVATQDGALKPTRPDLPVEDLPQAPPSQFKMLIELSGRVADPGEIRIPPACEKILSCLFRPLVNERNLRSCRFDGHSLLLDLCEGLATERSAKMAQKDE